MKRAPFHLALIALTAVLAGGFLAGPAPSSDALAQDLQEQVDRVFDRIEESRGAALGDGLRELEALGRGAVGPARKGLTRADGFVRVAAARILYSNELRDEALDALTKVISGRSAPARRAAADMAASLVGSDRELNDQEKNRIVESLRRQALESEDPLARVALWRAVYSLSPGNIEPVRKVREVLNSGGAREAREEAALALAEMGMFIGAKPVLAEMAKEPGDRGRLARAYLLLDRHTESASNRLQAQPKYDFKLLEEAVDLLKSHYYDPAKVVPEKVVEAATRGACASLDPYTTFMDEASIDQLKKEELGGNYAGIGARVSMRKDKAGNAWLTIEEPIFSGPAYKAGLRSNDKIIEVDGEHTVNRDLSELVRKLRGKEGTTANIKVVRRGWPKEKPYAIVRERIQLETTMHRMLPGGIGYIRLTTFGEQDVDLIEKAVKDMASMKVLVFDLRGNTGGYLRTAQKLASYFLDKGQVIVSTRGRGMPEDRKVAEGGKLTDVPLVMLVDEGSASASEILAGALQCHKRALLVGEKTFGKGSVQDMKYLKTSGEKSAVKCTISKWYLPDGRTVEKDKDKGVEGGVMPDVKAEPPDRDYWKDAEFERLRAGDDLDRFVKGLFEADKEKARQIAESDGGDSARYPGFDAFYDSIKTKASRDEIRELVREQVRKRVQDDQGRPLYLDFQTDFVLQRGILEACKKIQMDPLTIKEYAIFTRKAEAKSPDW